MHCKFCNRQFNPWVTQETWIFAHGEYLSIVVHYKYCTTCFDDHFKNKTGNRYCINCGSILPRQQKQRKSGKTYLTRSGWNTCYSCRSIIKEISTQKTIRECLVCRAPLSGNSTKYCKEHKPTIYKINPITNRRSSIAWQKNNPEKVNASLFTRYRPDQIYVLYECPCKHQKKHNHHFNYEIKHVVIRLCPACHAAEHGRLRSLGYKFREELTTTSAANRETGQS